MRLDQNAIATRDDILDALEKLERATKSIPPDKKAIYADALETERLTRGQLGDAVMACIKRTKVAFFPAVGLIIECARPPSVNAAPSNGHVSLDPIVALEREIEVETKWLRRHESSGNDFAARTARSSIDRAQDHVNRRLHERGLAKRYVGIGVEDFGSSDQRGEPAHVSQGDFNDWTHSEDE